MKEITSKKKKRKKKKPMDQDGNNDQKQNIARFRSSMIALCLAAMMWMMLMASNGIVVDGFVLTSKVRGLNDRTMKMEQKVVAAIGSDVCNYVNCNDVMEVDDGVDDVDNTTTYRLEENDLVTDRYGEPRVIILGVEGVNQTQQSDCADDSAGEHVMCSNDQSIVDQFKDLYLGSGRPQQNKQNGPVSDSSMIVLSSAEQSPAISFIDWQCRVYSMLSVLFPLSPDGEECCPSSDSLIMVVIPSAEQIPAISLRLRDWQCRAYFMWSNALLSSSLRIDECGPSSDALTDYSTSYMLLSTELDACVSCICSMSESTHYLRYGRQNSLNSDGSIVSAEYCGTCLEKRSRLKEPEVPVELNISDMVGVDMAGACKKASISCENIKQGGVSYVARHSQHAIEEKIAPDISKVLDISNRTAYMSQQHNGTSVGRYDYQGGDDVSLGSTSAGSVDSSGDEYTTVKADGSVSERCDIETESDIIAESGIGCEGQVDDLVGGMKDKSKVGIFSGKSNASMKDTEISTRPSVTESMTSATVVSNAKLRRLLTQDDVNMIHTDIDTGKDTGSISMDTMLKSSRYDSGEYCKARCSWNTRSGESYGSIMMGYHGIFERGGVLEGKVYGHSTIPVLGRKVGVSLARITP